MTAFEEAARSIDAVRRVALLDRSAGALFGKDRGACARSFLAYALVLPAILLWIAIDVAVARTDTPDRLAAAEMIATVIEVAGFPLLLRPVLLFYGRLDRWAWFVTGYNWFSAAQTALLLGALGLCGGTLGAWPLIAMQIYLYVVEAFLAEAVLEIGGIRAGSIVLLDAFFSYGWNHIAHAIGTGGHF